MKTFSRFLFSAGAALAIAFTFSCSGDDGGDGSPGPVKKEKISGLSEKGPFAKSSQITLYELDKDMKKTGKKYSGETSDGEGNFEVEIEGGELASPYIRIEVSGRYVSEVSGESASEPITLAAIADVKSKSIVNINVLTHLESERVLSLVSDSSKSFDKAKEQAQKEVFIALGMEAGSKSSEDMSLGNDQSLLAASVLLQGSRSAGEVSDLLDKFSRNIKDSGRLSGATKAEIISGLEDIKDVPGLENIAEQINGMADNMESNAGGDKNTVSPTICQDIRPIKEECETLDDWEVLYNCYDVCDADYDYGACYFDSTGTTDVCDNNSWQRCGDSCFDTFISNSMYFKCILNTGVCGALSIIECENHIRETCDIDADPKALARKIARR